MCRMVVALVPPSILHSRSPRHEACLTRQLSDCDTTLQPMTTVVVAVVLHSVCVAVPSRTSRAHLRRYSYTRGHVAVSLHMCIVIPAMSLCVVASLFDGWLFSSKSKCVATAAFNTTTTTTQSQHNTTTTQHNNTTTQLGHCLTIQF